MRSTFEWSSALGISTLLFMICGVIYTLLGIVGTAIYSFGAVKLTKQFYQGETIDPMLLGRTPVEMLNDSPHLAHYIEIILIAAWSLSAGMGGSRSVSPILVFVLDRSGPSGLRALLTC